MMAGLKVKVIIKIITVALTLSLKDATLYSVIGKQVAVYVAGLHLMPL